MSSERRKRVRIPFTIRAAGIICILLPFLNYISFGIFVKSFSLSLFIQSLDLLQILLLIACMVSGFGLLKVKKWGWWFFLFICSGFILQNIYSLYLARNLFNIGALFRSLVGIAFIVFFLRKDISAPYFKMYPRGWRGQKRSPIVMDVILDGTSYKTKDISETGLYAEWIGCTKNLGDAVSIEMDGKAKVGGIVRIDENGVGIAFRN